MSGFRPGEEPPPVVLAAPATLTFTSAADAGGTDRDVLFGYQVFLGRDPETSFVIADAKTSPVGAFLRALMGSGEFQSAVLDKLAYGRLLPHETAAAAPSAEQIDWLFRYIRVPARAEAALRAASGWPDWLRTLVAVPGFPSAPSRQGSAVPDGVSPQEVTDGFVMIHIEQPKAGERLRPGGTVSGSGWAIAPSDVAEVAVELDGTLLTHARYGLPRPDVARNFPHYRHVDHCGFSFTATVPASVAQTGASTLSVLVRSQRGETGRRSVRLVLPEAVATGAGGGGQAAWPIRLSVEEAVVDASRTLRLRGWAVSTAALHAVTVTLGETPLGAARHGLPRPDIALSQPGYGNAAMAGFVLVSGVGADVPGGPGFVRVQAQDAAGHVRQAIVPVQVPYAAAGPGDKAGRSKAGFSKGAGEGELACACETAILSTEGVLWLRGWVAAPHGAPQSGMPEVGIELDGTRIGSASIERGGNAGAASGRCCFSYTHTLPRRQRKPVRRLAITVTAGDGRRRVMEMALTAEVAGPELAEAIASLAAPDGLALPPGAVPGSSMRTEFGAEEGQAGLRMEIDRPILEQGAAVDALRGALSLIGWAVGRTGVDRVSVFAGEALLGHAHLGVRREDIGAAFPDYPGALMSGFALVVPPGTLAAGDHVIRLVAQSGAAELVRSFDIRVEAVDAMPVDEVVRRTVPPAEASFGCGLLEQAGYRPVFEIAVAVAKGGKPVLAALEVTLRGLEAQAYPAWSACVYVQDTSTLKAVQALAWVTESGGRISAAMAGVARGSVAGGPVAGGAGAGGAGAGGAGAGGAGTRSRAAPPAAAPPGAPHFAMVLRPGDRLSADALLELALGSMVDRSARLFYGDDVRVDAASGVRAPFFKPDWSPDLLLAMNYIGRAWCARADLLAEAGLSPGAMGRSADYDGVLRLTEAAASAGTGQPNDIVHLGRALVDCGDWADAVGAEAASLTAALARRAAASGVEARVEAGAAPGTWRVRRRVPAASAVPARGKARTQPRRVPAGASVGGSVPGRISIIMPTCGARDLVRTAIRTIRETSAPALAGGRDVEIVLLDNTPAQHTELRAWLRQAADVVIDMPDAFNWSAFNNAGARAASGEFLLFLNDDIEATQPDWLDALLEHAQRPEVGVVGARLLYPDGKIQHAGLYLVGAHGRHAFRFDAADAPGPFGLAQVAREVIAVTGACQMVRAADFAAVGGFDEAHSVINNDVDFCLRIRRAGLAVIYTPYATLTHHELASRAALEDVYDEAAFQGQWRRVFQHGDPYRNPRLDRDSDQYAADLEPVQRLYAGRRGPEAAAVRRILVVKLDHIGDFLTCLPALRVLKQRFPNARIDLLAAAASAELARGEAVISETIVFDFFHVRSGDGQKGVGEQEFRALAARLAPARYDIAIDLRMHPDTRVVLPHTGAAFLAGYDHDGRFPFLDVALLWEGDIRLVHKRAHVAERLLQLVGATAFACDDGLERGDAWTANANRPLPAAAKGRRAGKPAMVAGMPPALAGLPGAFLARRLVCIHPGVGNAMRQWPVSSYAALIDMLADAGLHAILVGAPEEAPIAEEVLRLVSSPGVAESLAGRVRLGELAEVMRACVLFVGNNSGPKHLAASLGMPTVGIHSGVVDATEWAPLGARAVALQRRMLCSPCYLEFASECPRGLACLTGLRPSEVFDICRQMLV